MPKKMINGREIELNRKHVNWGHLILHIVLLGVCLISIFPFIWMISSSLKDSELIFSFPPQMIPNPVTWQNYPEAWKATAMGRAMINSLFIAVVATGGGCLVSSRVAYGFAKIDFQFKTALFMVVLNNCLAVLSVKDCIQNIIKGLVIIGVLTLYNRDKAVRQ